MAITATKILDLVSSTQRELGRLRFQQIAQRLRDYTVMDDMLKKDKVQFDSGVGIQRTVMTEISGAAKQVAMFQPDALNIGKTLGQIQVDWRHTTVNYAYERREFLMNRGATKIVDLIKTRRADALISLAELMEAQFWSLPAAGDDLSVNGVPYWVVPNNTQGFNGANPAGYSNVANLNHARWRNYSGQYTSVIKSDLLKLMRQASRKTNFKSPVDVNDYAENRGRRFRIFTNDAVIDDMENLLELQNDDLGMDLMPFAGATTFKKSPIIVVDYLNADTTNPVYMLDMAYFYPVFLQGDYMTETDPKYIDSQHNTMAVFIDCTWNVLCVDRRRQAVFTK